MNRNKIILYFFFNIVIGLLASSWQRLAPFLRADRIVHAKITLSRKLVLGPKN